jgi:hypothetical protein
LNRDCVRGEQYTAIRDAEGEGKRKTEEAVKSLLSFSPVVMATEQECNVLQEELDKALALREGQRQRFEAALAISRILSKAGEI